MKNALQGLHMDIELDSSLSIIVEKGFIRRQDFYLLKALVQTDLQIRPDLFFDQTDVEQFLNHFHIDGWNRQYGLNRIKAEHRLAQALLFVSEIFKLWRATGPELPLIGIISLSSNDRLEIDVADIKVSFYVDRVGVLGWLDNDLEKYKENAVLEINSTIDCNFLDELKSIAT